MIPLAALTPRERAFVRLNDLNRDYDSLAYLPTEPDEQFTYQFLENLSGSFIQLTDKINDLIRLKLAQETAVNPDGQMIDLEPMPQLAEYLYNGTIFNQCFHAVTNNEDTNQTLLRQLEDVLKPFREMLMLDKCEAIYLFPDGVYFSYLIMPEFAGINDGGLHFVFFLEFEDKTLALQALYDGPLEKLANHLEDDPAMKILDDKVELGEVNALYEQLRAAAAKRKSEKELEQVASVHDALAAILPEERIEEPAAIETIAVGATPIGE